MKEEDFVAPPECFRENSVNTVHWSTQMREAMVIPGKNGFLHAVLQGGASDDSFCYIAAIEKNSIRYENRSDQLREGDIILEVEGEKVGGFMLQDLLDLILSVIREGRSVILKVTSEELLSRRLTSHLNMRFNKDSLDHQLQQTIRRNIYKKALPYTTRPPRDDEVDGVDYKFLSVEEFLELERSGKLLEKGIYEGNYYGTPKPDVVVSHIIPWNGLPEQLYSMVNKQIGCTTTTAAASLLVATKPSAALSTKATATAVTTRSANVRCPSLTPSPLSSDSSANTTLVSPLKRDCGNSCQSTVMDNDDAMNNNNSNNSINDNKLKFSPSCAQPGFLDNARETPNSIRIESSMINQTGSDSIQNGQLISTVLVKSSRGLGFTIVGVEDEETGGVWLVVKTIMPGGPADVDGKLQRGDILVQVNERSVCGMSHGGVVQMFRQFEVDQPIAVQVIRTPNSANFDLLDVDPYDPTTEVITTVAVGSEYPSEDEFYRSERLGIHIVKGKSGFGFTLADRPEGQKVKQLVDVERCRGLEEGDLLLEINDQMVRELSHADVVRILKSSPVDKPAKFIIERRVPINVAPPFSALRVDDIIINNNINYNSPQVRRPTSAITHGKTHQQLYPHGHRLIMASPTSPSSSSPSLSLTSISNRTETATPTLPPPQVMKPTFLVHQCPQHTPDFIPASAFSQLRGRGVVAPDRSPYLGHGDAVRNDGERSIDLIPHYQSQHPAYQYQCSWVSGNQCNNAACKQPHFLQNPPQQHLQSFVKDSNGSCFDPSQSQQHLSSCESLHLQGSYHHFHSPVMHTRGLVPLSESQNTSGGFEPHGSPFQMVLQAESLRFVNLKRSQTGFGFRIVGGREEGTQVSIGYIVPGGAAHLEGSLKVGQEIFTVDGRSVVGAWHKDLVDLVTMASQKGEITIGVKDTDIDNKNGMSSNNNCHDVVLTRDEENGFGFYILSSSLKTGSIIGQIIQNSPASRVQDLKVGDQIQAINGCPIDCLSHTQIVELIKSSGKTIKLTVKDSRVASASQKVYQLPDQHSPGQNDDLIPRTDSALSSASACQVTNKNTSNSPDMILRTTTHLTSSYSFPPPPSIAFTGNPIAKFERAEVARTSDDVVVLQVELARGQKGFGFSIRGGHEFNSLPMYVLKVADDGPARADGRLQAGDEILKINGRTTAGMTHKEAINIVQSSVHRLNLTVRRFVNTEIVEEL